MSFSSQEITDDAQGRLPQFSELHGIPSPSLTTASTAEFTSGGNVQPDAAAQSRSIYTTAASSSQKQLQLETAEAMRNSEILHSLLQIRGPYLTMWSDKLLQLCDTSQINIPNYSQSTPVLDLQPNNLQAQFVLGNMCASQANIVKQELSEEEKDSSKDSDIQLRQREATQYFQKLQATSLPHTLQHIIKLQTEQVKKEKEEEKIEHTQNNILNIPNIFRNIALQSNSGFPSPPDPMLGISPDISLHMEMEQQENEGNFQPVLKVEQQVQTDAPRPEKRPRFRAKIGEVKITISADGTVLYCCPECNIGLPNKADIEQHIQAHLQERKYMCKECGYMLKRKEHLDQHMRGHSNDRPYKCTVCQKGFKRNEHLTRHYSIHSGNKNFSCTTCKKAFSRKDHLSKHMQTHTGMRKSKMKEDTYYVDQKDKLSEKSDIDIAAMPKQEVSYVMKDSLLPKQEATLLHHIQNLQNPSFLQTIVALKEQTLRDANQSQHEENININDVLPQNVRYLMPS
ncbi:hypothetical protein DMN91_002397 [Ooceraea biroi]|uniref:C2H2-type domain-containing protein n=1 Tax=Ooceraea biroi TaxID=2015173 RepID=A0A3L8DWJ8_OOCBI|nr:histone-lysine N-methyltransferase PRDM9 isoform X1 [Ooceraea biroi]RLU24309.1 hypothetical protein DMN91_002397 [Ooceraea biroi]